MLVFSTQLFELLPLSPSLLLNSLNLEKPLLSLYGTEWSERGYRLSACGPKGAANIWFGKEENNQPNY
jgi:hypothetical protein